MTGLSTPAGFRIVEEGAGRLMVDGELADEICACGLARGEAWDDLLRRAAPGVGRGATARLLLPSGRRLVLKKLRRGGLLGPLWRDRFLGARRLLDNLSLPLAARARGVTTPAALAVLAVQGPPGLFQGWLALDEIRDARDLATRLDSSSPPTAVELTKVMNQVRVMHEAGVEHRDLNLGNLLIRESTAGDTQVFVTDLDGARLHEAGLPFSLRQRALRRLERSWAKLFHGTRSDGADTGWIYRGYAGADAEMARRLERGRRMGRFSIHLHRLSWRR